MKKLKVEVPEFPPEIIADVLSRLPVDSIVACKRVCKTWRTLIDDPSFLYTYNNNIQLSVSTSSSSFYDVDENSISLGFFIMGRDIGQTPRYGEYTQTTNLNGDDQVRFKLTKPIKFPCSCYKEYSDRSKHYWNLIGSSNGLICLSAYHRRRVLVINQNRWPWLFHYTIYIYNPVTREYVDLGTETSHSYGFHYMGTFFGYHPSTKEYKVVRIDYKKVPKTYHVQVYTLGTRTSPGSTSSRWRDKGEISYLFSGLKKPSVLVNGALHWTTKDRKIVSFDLEDEEFRIVPSPPRPLLPQPTQGDTDQGVELTILRVYNLELGVLGGCSCAYDFKRVYEKYQVPMNIWILRGSSNNNYSWNNILSIWRFCTPLALLRTGVLVYDGKSKIASYDPEYQNFCSVSKESFDYDGRLPFIISYMKSFVSLKALGEENVKMISDEDINDSSFF